MARRYYSSTAVGTTLANSANNSTTTIEVTALSGYPAQTPWTAIIDQDTASEEVVEVTNVSGTTLTVTRGVDGTSGVSHNAGAVFRHGVSARDFDEANAFVNGGGVSNSLVNAKGDLVTATANDTPAILTAGSNGQMLMADSSATAGLRYVDPPANRNLVINGAMQVAQRGTSATSLAGGGSYNTTDRWRLGGNMTNARFTMSVENDAPTGSGLRKSVKLLVTTADNSLTGTQNFPLQQILEGQDLQRIRKGTSDAQQLTLSFWVKSNVTGTYIARLVDNDNTRGVSASYTVSASATWERKTLTFPADTTGALDNDNAGSLFVIMYLAAGPDLTSGTLNTTWESTINANVAVGQTNFAAATNNYWQITGVQLETGPVATPFEFEPYEATLRKCQRYYYLHAEGAVNIATGYYYTGTEVQAFVQFPTTMRISPSGSTVSGTNYYRMMQNGLFDDFNDLIVFADSPNTALIYQSSNVSGTEGKAGRMIAMNAAARLAFSAEL